MRRYALVSAVVFSMFGAAATPAQQTTFRSDVSLVTIDVTVLDKDGKPVPGLSSEDFEIKLNGKVQPVRAIAFLQAASPGDKPVPTPDAPVAPSAPATAAPKPAAMIVAKEVEVRRTVSNQDNLTGAAPANPAPAAPAAPAATSAPPPRVAGNIEPRVFVILIDDLSFPAMRGKALFASAQKFVDSVPASDPVGFTTTSSSMTVNPTLDRAAVKAGLARAVGEFNDPRELRKGDPLAAGKGGMGGKDGPIGLDESIDIDRGDDTLLKEVIARECFNGDRNSVVSMSVQDLLRTSRCASDVASEARRTAALLRQTKGRQLAALTGVINAMRTASGIRHLVYVTDGMAVSRDVIDLKPITSTAAAAGVQFSVIMEDPEAININAMGRAQQTDGIGASQADTPSQRTRQDNKLMLNGAQTFTDVVGGIFYKVIGNPDRQFERVLLASSAVYRLGVELPAGTAPGKELTLSADVKRPGLTVRSNRVAINTPINAPAIAPANPAPAAPAAPAVTSAPSSVDDLLKAALNENRSLRGVPIRLAATVRRSSTAPGQVDVSVNVLFPPSVKTPITTLIGLVDETNAMRVNRRVVDNVQQPVQFLFPVAAGNYAIRFGAAGADGALGTIELPIAVKLHTMGPFTTSDVLTYFVGDTSQKATLYTTEDVPTPVEPSTYHAAIEFYPAGAMPSEPPVVAWTLVRDGETKPVLEEETEGRVGTNLFRSDIEIPFAALPPGTYTIRATLLVDDKPAGSAGAVIKKK